MKLSEFIKEAEKMYPEEDPEIKIVGVGFEDILELVKREEYYDDNGWTGTKYEKGNFICIETIR